jgi:hypothetical protein
LREQLGDNNLPMPEGMVTAQLLFLSTPWANNKNT